MTEHNTNQIQVQQMILKHGEKKVLHARLKKFHQNLHQQTQDGLDRIFKDVLNGNDSETRVNQELPSSTSTSETAKIVTTNTQEHVPPHIMLLRKKQEEERLRHQENQESTAPLSNPRTNSHIQLPNADPDASRRRKRKRDRMSHRRSREARDNIDVRDVVYNGERQPPSSYVDASDSDVDDGYSSGHYTGSSAAASEYEINLPGIDEPYHRHRSNGTSKRRYKKRRYRK